MKQYKNDVFTGIIMDLCLYHPENRRDTDNVIKSSDKVDLITLLLITFHWLIVTMLDHITVVFS